MKTIVFSNESYLYADWYQFMLFNKKNKSCGKYARIHHILDSIHRYNIKCDDLIQLCNYDKEIKLKYFDNNLFTDEKYQKFENLEIDNFFHARCQYTNDYVLYNYKFTDFENSLDTDKQRSCVVCYPTRFGNLLDQYYNNYIKFAMMNKFFDNDVKKFMDTAINNIKESLRVNFNFKYN